MALPSTLMAALRQIQARGLSNQSLTIWLPGRLSERFVDESFVASGLSTDKREDVLWPDLRV